MRNFKIVVFALILYCLLPAATAQTTRPKKASAPKASVDLLISRVDSYWKLLHQGNRTSAAQYVDPSDRERFLSRTIPQFSNPLLGSLELSADRTEAKVIVTVKRTLPIGAVDWPVKDKWIFKNNSWYLQSDLGSISMLSGAQQSQMSGDTMKIEGLKRELRDRVRFDQTVLDFGTVRQGKEVSLSLKYSLAGNEPLRTEIGRRPPGVTIRGLKDQALTPGQQQELTIGISTGNYDGAFSERIVLVAHRQEIEVPFEFLVQGFVYTPVSVSPREELRFNPTKGAREKEILVRNNSKSDLELKSLQSESGAIQVESLPATIPAGQQLKLKVRQIKSVPKPDTLEHVVIVFTQPIDEMESISLSVVLNAREKKIEQGVDPFRNSEIQELIRKNQIVLPQP